MRSDTEIQSNHNTHSPSSIGEETASNEAVATTTPSKNTKDNGKKRYMKILFHQAWNMGRSALDVIIEPQPRLMYICCLIDDQTSPELARGHTSANNVDSPSETRDGNARAGTPEYAEGCKAALDSQTPPKSGSSKSDGHKSKGKTSKPPKQHPIVDKLRKAGFTVTMTSMTKKMFHWVKISNSKSGRE